MSLTTPDSREYLVNIEDGLLRLIPGCARLQTDVSWPHVLQLVLTLWVSERGDGRLDNSHLRATERCA